MKVGLGYCDHPDSALAGNLAARQALEASGRTDSCDLVLLFCTARHDQEILRQEVAKTIGSTSHIFGGGAAGIITNDQFGYAGDNVGVACIWLDDSSFQVVSEGGLDESEYEAGLKLGKKLAEAAVSSDSPVLLFYDAVNRVSAENRLIMATWLLEGIEKQLGFLPYIMGAGLTGDHLFTPTRQFIGSTMGEHHVFALTFSEDIHVDQIILHGCRPASPYYTVTKADDSVILEIEGKPAIAFLDKLVGPAVTPDEYPFFLILGINHGEADDDYDERNYANRLCQGIDLERGGIIMFEPDMVAGTRFQIMTRTLEPHYIRPQVEGLLAGLKDKEPVFAFYIDCAGRCAGYGGTDLEDARVLQDLVQDRFPLFGIYTGVEIAPLGGKARSLDWTGVFCVFSKKKDYGGRQKTAASTHTVWDAGTTASGEQKSLSYKGLEELCVQNMAKALSLDTQNILIRVELEQKRRGFRLLAELSVSLRGLVNQDNIFLSTTKRINASLNMQKTIFLRPDSDGKFIPFVLQGYTPEEKASLSGVELEVDADLLDLTKFVLVTAENEENQFFGLRKTLNLPYFISAPIVVENKIFGILVTGRMIEAPPFLSRLSKNEAETVQAIAALLASIMLRQRLDEVTRQARIDILTGLFNRRVLEQRVTALLQQDMSDGVGFAFVLIDLDYFKEINDNYGHVAGDRVLRLLAETLLNTFHSTDIIARFGGDELVVFCALRDDVKSIVSKAEKLVGDWSITPMFNEEGEVFYSTLSIGISIAPIDGTTYNELLSMADIALYETKQKGRNGYAMYSNNEAKRV